MLSFEARVDPSRGGVAGAGLPAQRRVPPLPVSRLHRPDQSGAGQPFRPPLPQARRRTAMERLAAPHLPDRGPAHLPDARGGARPASPAGCAGSGAAASAVARLRARTSARRVAADRGREGERANRGGDRQGVVAAPALPGRGRRHSTGTSPTRSRSRSTMRASDLPLRPDGGRDRERGPHVGLAALRRCGRRSPPPDAPSRWSSWAGTRCVWRQPAGCSTSGRRRLPRP